MKKLNTLALILTLVFFASCGTETNNDIGNNGKGNNGQQNVTNTGSQDNNSQLVDFDKLEVTDWVTGLNTPWSLVFLSNDRALVSQRGGDIAHIKNGKIETGTYYKVSDVHEEGEGGLMGLEKDPNFASNGYLYIMYTYKNNSGDVKNKIVRLKDDGTKATFDKVLLDEIPGALYHNGGRLKFGPDSKLYVTTGDAREPDSAQDLKSLSGKILRMNNDGSIPNDNPFTNSYVYSYGHRNLQGLAFEPNTGELFSSGHGPTGEINGWEKNDRIDHIVAGGNYGWPEILGFSDNDEYIDPLVLWETNGKPPAGMSFWNGELFVGTLKSERLIAIKLQKVSNDKWQATGVGETFVDKYGRLRDVVVGPDGDLYVATSNRDGRGTPKEGDDKILKVTLLK